ncbi:phosphate butyryltransferase [Thermanaerovibrio acidaminovorans]|jgi:phosphate butyryltransferase|uniref:Phosphate butyryltransferase n=1 Tax=Thermanaerovibrio acidaminovorans (strain ATCC 49978 / DSM 6589 / Su883) TaxID=525903 RepID=D1B8T6_THEAS|nr:phosphate butyryltransferase [Thermanaerovibrio acidaminovorans]ACZ18689.1 phosphate butyryltransferase [Thermanaerovibrio acidaminovorans DSM 6589]
MKQLRSLTELLDYAKEVGPLKVSVACAEDAEVLEAVEEARKAGIAEAILVGNGEAIASVASKLGIDLSNYEVVDERGGEAAAALVAVEQVSSGRAHILMKGMVKTANFLKAVLNKEKGLRTGSLLSHVYIHDVEGYDRIFFITDPAFNMYPDLPAKVSIVENVVKVAHSFGISCPKVAALAAVEVVNPDMPPTLDAAALVQMNRRGQIKGCVIDGPLALDNAVSEEAARHKGIVSDVAGHADILMVPDIEAGNMMAKAIIYFAKGKTAGLVVGAKAPIVLTSRSDSAETKLLSIASAVAMAAFGKK